MRVCIRRDTPEASGVRVEIASQGHLITIAAKEEGPRSGVQVSGVERFEHRVPQNVGPFTLTPFVAADSHDEVYAVHVEADGASVLYAADMRTGAVQKVLAAGPHVDALLMDSATIGWGAGADAFPTEAEFEDKFVSLFRTTSGLPLVWCSRQNVDRLHTIHRACRKTNRYFIVDLTTAAVLRSSAKGFARRRIDEQLRVFVSAKKVQELAREQASVLADIPEGLRIYPQELAAATPTSVMLFRPSLMQDLERARCLAGARLIFSMWLGYLEYEKANPVLEWLEEHGIPLEQCHAAGHAGIMELITLRRAFGAAPVTPVRARLPGRFDELFGGVRRRADGEWFDIVPLARVNPV